MKIMVILPTGGKIIRHNGGLDFIGEDAQAMLAADEDEDLQDMLRTAADLIENHFEGIK